MDKDSQMIVRRFADLSRTADLRGIYCFSDFLGLNEVSLLHREKANIPGETFFLFGGYPEAERVMACFLPIPEKKDEFDVSVYPIDCIAVKPQQTKFGKDLTHRDFLGAILGLGLERGKIGDILVTEEEAFFFCEHHVSAFLLEELRQVGRKNVSCSLRDVKQSAIRQPRMEVTGTVSSCRLDSVLAVAFTGSRSSLSELIPGGKVYVNGTLTENTHYVLKEGDIVSVRGMGKFEYRGITGQSKKGRYGICLSKYV